MIKVKDALGEIAMTKDALGKIVGIAATSCYGVVGMAAKSTTEDIALLLKIEQFERGVKVSMDGDALSIDLHIIVSYGINIRAITESIVNKVRYKVEELTGFVVSTVNVFVDDMKL